MPRKQQRRANGEGTVVRRKDGRYEARESRHVDADGTVSQRSYVGRLPRRWRSAPRVCKRPQIPTGAANVSP